jgi:hypothetical protein
MSYPKIWYNKSNLKKRMRCQYNLYFILLYIEHKYRYRLLNNKDVFIDISITFRI